MMDMVITGVPGGAEVGECVGYHWRKGLGGKHAGGLIPIILFRKPKQTKAVNCTKLVLDWWDNSWDW